MGDLYPQQQQENVVIVVAVAAAGWWPLVGCLGLYYGQPHVAVAGQLNVAVQPEMTESEYKGRFGTASEAMFLRNLAETSGRRSCRVLFQSSFRLTTTAQSV